MVREYQTMETEKGDGVAVIRMAPRASDFHGRANPVDELGDIFARLRDDDEVRVIVLTGAEDGQFLGAYPTEAKRDVSNPASVWRATMGIVRCHQAMAEIEKPIVARVNGDAIGLGQAFMLASDIIVAREDAKFSDLHLGMGQVIPAWSDSPVGPAYGLAPGDGGGALIPLYMGPAKAKEYVMLSLECTAREWADSGIINHAVPMEQLDSVVDGIVDRLLQKSAYALAWTKRILNRHVAAQLNLTLDAAAAYEFLNFVQANTLGSDDRTLGYGSG